MIKRSEVHRVDNNWRQRPLARALVTVCCWLLLSTSSAPLYAGPPPAPNALPQTAASWVSHGNATLNTVGNTMTIDQASAKAILNWKSFNIGKDAKVQFNQPSVDATALNIINDSSATQIFGQLSANGNIYLINNNGILFNQTAQVNVHGLVASTLNIDANQFVNASLPTAINDSKAALEGGSAADASVVVEGGARIATDSGGQVLMFAPTVVNGGEISTPDGQTILAASKDKVYLAASDTNPNLRGLLVEVDSGGNVTNVGKIVAERGNITLLGLAVNQNGYVRATTSVDLNGSIRLLARDTAKVYNRDDVKLGQLPDDATNLPSQAHLPMATKSHTVTLGAGSVTEVAADDGGKTAVDAQPQNPSRIDVIGQTIVMQNNSRIVAKSGKVNLVATTTPNDLQNNSIGKSTSQIYLGKNSSIDVSGENVELPMSRHLVEVELRGDELKDSPQQRNGILHGAKVMVDIGQGSPLIADLAPTLAKIQKGVTERMTAGGTINLNSQGGVVVGQDAALNIAGGSVRYAAGMSNTAKLISKGRVFDIGSADPNRQYDGILGLHTTTDPKWGKRVFGKNSVFNVGNYRDGFTDGAKGGNLAIDTQWLYGFDLAQLQAASQSGVNQRALTKSPAGGSVTINLGQGLTSESLATIQNVAIERASKSVALAASDSNDLADRDVNISAQQLNNSGLGSFSLRTNGRVTQREDATLHLAPAASLTLRGSAVEIDGGISVAGGTIKLVADAPNYNSDHIGNFSVLLGTHSLLDVSGAWLNDLPSLNKSNTPTQPLTLNGGAITITASGDLTVGSGAQLRADGGAQLNGAGKLMGGDGGTINLVSRSDQSTERASTLLLQGDLSAYGFGKGGTLTLSANAIQIGGAAPANDTLWLDAGLFQRGGFGTYSLTANLRGLDVAQGAVITPLQANRRIASLRAASRWASYSDLRQFSSIVELPAYLRAATNISLAVSATKSRDLRVERDAQINVGPGGSIALSSNYNILVDGDLSAPGGHIALNIDASDSNQVFDPAQMIWLGSHAHLLAAAARIAQPNSRGLALGKVFDAGAIDVNAPRGSIIAAPGSRFDVSGASFAQDTPARRAFTHAGVNASAGAIRFTAANSLLIYSDLFGAAAGSDGQGGLLSYQLDASKRGDNKGKAYAALNMLVSDAMPAWSTDVQFAQALPTGLDNTALIGVDSIQRGGFTRLSLAARNMLTDNNAYANPGKIIFTSDVNLALRDSLLLDTTNIQLNNHQVNLSAATLALGQTQDMKTAFSQAEVPTEGQGELTLKGAFIELLDNIGIGGARRVALLSSGDVRVRANIDNGTGSGVKHLTPAQLTTTGDMFIQSTQLYPSTLTDYTFSLTGANSTFSTANSGAARSALLSAGGKLTVNAAIIDHAGTIAAPLGEIDLNASNRVHLAPGSMLDVSASNMLIPFGRLQGGDLSWIYPIDTNYPMLIQHALQKTINITAPAVAMDKGATVNVSGGGDVYGIEQVPGPGGSKDFLDPAYAKGAFAVVPWLNGSVSPFDAVEMKDFTVQGAAPQIGATIYLDAAAGLPAGNYAILPAHYALLQGAYLVTPKATGWRQGQTAKQVDGTVLVSGRYGRALSGSYDSQWQGFAVEPGSVARTRSEYTIKTGDQFFAKDTTGARAADAGRVAIAVDDKLDLLGSVIGAAAQNGRRAQLDIIANEIEVISAPSSGHSHAVQLDVAGLNGLGVDSILLGGRRSGYGKEIGIAVGANNVTVRGGATLAVPDIILAARNTIALDSGATISATGNSTADTQLFNIDGPGALLRASSAGQADVKRANADNPSSGVLKLAQGSTVYADQSMLLDASSDMTLDGSIGFKSRNDLLITSLNLTANRISLGDGSGAASDGVKFSNTTLNSFNARALRLSSRSAIDFYGDVALTNERVEFNTGALRNMQGGDVKISAADTLQLDNTITAHDIDNGLSAGKLTLAAKNIELGSNRDALGKLQANTATAQSMDLFGFTQTDLGAAGVTAQLQGLGNFALRSAGDINVIADRIGGSNGSSTAITATGGGAINLKAAHATIDTSIKTLSETTAQWGAKLAIEGRSVTQGTHIDLPSGVLTLKATGVGAHDNVSLAAGSVTDVGGRNLKLPQDSVINSDGGEIHLRAATGDVVADAQAKVLLGGSGGNSGLLDIITPGKTSWKAGIQAAPVNGFKGGNLQLDVGSFSDGDFGAWLQRLAASGIDQRINIRSRNGDLKIENNLRATDLTIAADTGSVTLAATIDASGTDGGHVALWGGNNLNLNDGARINANANANASGGRGGKVELGARGGAVQSDGSVLASLDGSALVLGSSAINVAGNGGRNGQVLLRAPRNATNDDVALANTGLTISGAERIALEAFDRYDASSDGVVGAIFTGALTDATAFMTHQSTIKTRLGSFAAAPEFHLQPGIDIYSTGDLELSAALDLSSRRFGGEPGVLTLRAANNLTISHNLLDGTVNNLSSVSLLKNASKKLLKSDFSWDYRLVAGADLQSADPTATQAMHGDLVVSGGADIITGAGRVGLYAGNTVDVQSADSVIASLGRTLYSSYLKPTGGASELLPDTGTIDPYNLASANSRYPMYPIDGGDVTISAGSDVNFVKTTSFFSDWIERLGSHTLAVGGGAGIPKKTLDITTWGVMLDYLQQGIAALGGGNMSVAAGGNVVNLNAALPLTGKQVGVGVNQVAISGGGNLQVVAGGDILSPRILVDKGRANLNAGGRIGAGDSSAGDLNAVLALADTQLYLTARGEIAVDAVFNSTVMPLSKNQGLGGNKAQENYFFTYTDTASLSLQSLNGDVLFNNDSAGLVRAFSSRFAATSPLFGTQNSEDLIFEIYPGQLRATAANGDIRVGGNMTLFPSANGQLAWLAGNNVGTTAGRTDRITVNLSDADPATLPNATHPALKLASASADSVINHFLAAQSSALIHAAQPLHSNDTSAAIIAALGGDVASDKGLTFAMAKPTRIYAGQDISNVSFDIEHSNDNQISELIAGRDIGFPLVADPNLGRLLTDDENVIRIEGPGRLDVMAGRDINLGGSAGIESIGNQKNPALPQHGANINLLAGINGPSALTDPILYSQFADHYFTADSNVTGSYIDWFASGKFGGNVIALVGAFTGKQYSSNADALADFRTLPVLTQQAVSLDAYQVRSEITTGYSASLIDFVSLERFNGDLATAVTAVTKVPYANNTLASVALAQLPAAQQRSVARQVFDAASPSVRRELLLSVLNAEVRQGGIQNAKGLVLDKNADGFARSYAAIAQMFPAKSAFESPWQGNVNLVLSAVRTLGDGDINIVVPGGNVNVGLASSIAGLNKEAGQLGIITQGYGAINGIASGDFNINQSRIFSLGGGDVMLWSSLGSVDAGKGAKTALTVPPPQIVVDPNTGAIKVVFAAAVSGSGIQAASSGEKRATDRGALLLDDGTSTPINSDTRLSRLRYLHSLTAGNVYLFAPQGAINAGDAGISAAGNLLLAAHQIIGADNISVGGTSVGVPTTTSISAGTLSLGDVASAATQSATASMNDAIKDAAAASAEGNVAFVTVDIIGVGK